MSGLSKKMDRRALLAGAGALAAMAFMVRLNPATSVREIYILAGQSNMSGRDNISNLAPFAFPRAHKVFNYANDGAWKAAQEPIDSDAGQIDSVSADSTAAASPGLSFGDTIAGLRPVHQIGLVPCAKGGTTIAQWQKSGLGRDTLYGSMVARALEAAALGPIKGLLFYQGESDASNQTNADAWAASFLAMFDNLRVDIGVPDLKAVVTRLHADPGSWGSYWSNVQTSQATLHGARDGAIAVVDASDLEGISGDLVHITAASAVTLGQRYAAAMHGLLEA